MGDRLDDVLEPHVEEQRPLAVLAHADESHLEGVVLGVGHPVLADHPCSAVMAAVATADTRAGSAAPVACSRWTKRAVADRPEPAAVGSISVGVVMACSCLVAGGRPVLWWSC
jgi:hypothetical protein